MPHRIYQAAPSGRYHIAFPELGIEAKRKREARLRSAASEWSGQASNPDLPKTREFQGSTGTLF